MLVSTVVLSRRRLSSSEDGKSLGGRSVSRGGGFLAGLEATKDVKSQDVIFGAKIVD